MPNLKALAIKLPFGETEVLCGDGASLPDFKSDFTVDEILWLTPEAAAVMKRAVEQASDRVADASESFGQGTEPGAVLGVAAVNTEYIQRFLSKRDK